MLSANESMDALLVEKMACYCYGSYCHPKIYLPTSPTGRLYPFMPQIASGIRGSQLGRSLQSKLSLSFTRIGVSSAMLPANGDVTHPGRSLTSKIFTSFVAYSTQRSFFLAINLATYLSSIPFIP